MRFPEKPHQEENIEEIWLIYKAGNGEVKLQGYSISYIFFTRKAKQARERERVRRKNDLEEDVRPGPTKYRKSTLKNTTQGSSNGWCSERKRKSPYWKKKEKRYSINKNKWKKIKKNTTVPNARTVDLFFFALFLLNSLKHSFFFHKKIEKFAVKSSQPPYSVLAPKLSPKMIEEVR